VIDYLLEKNVDAIKLNDDWGDQRGVLIGKERWVRLIYPRIKCICEYIKKKSKDTNIFLHSDGNIESILGKIAEAGIEVINPVQPEVMNVYSIKKQFGDVFTLFGVISGQKTMPFGTPEDVINEIKDSVHNLSYNGGLILAPGIIVCEDYPKENILAFIETCRNQDFS
jgi:uroporphyrinogen decarboxylase